MEILEDEYSLRSNNACSSSFEPVPRSTFFPSISGPLFALASWLRNAKSSPFVVHLIITFDHFDGIEWRIAPAVALKIMVQNLIFMNTEISKTEDHE